MKYILMIFVLGMSSLAFADAPAKDGERDLQFRCHFRSADKKGVTCTVRGEACVKWEDDLGVAEVSKRCDRDRDDNRIRIECSNGYSDNDRVRGSFERDDGSRTLVIKSLRDRDSTGPEDLLRIFNVRRIDDDESFRAHLRIDGGARFIGRCELRFERDFE